jgi:hypothetical protein
LRSQTIVIGILAVLGGGVCSKATNFSFTGTFSFDTDVQFFTFTLANPTAGVSFRTWSYVGGTNAAGTVIPSGGFEPQLSLFAPDGTGMNPGPSGPCTGNTGNPLTTLAPDPITGACADVYYPTTLSFPGGIWAPGTYTVALSEYINPAVNNLSDGFLLALQGFTVPGNYTCMVGAPGVQGNPPTIAVDQPFCDEWDPGTQRTGNWALDIIGVDSATGPVATPGPGTLPFFLVGSSAVAILLRRRRTRA